jgi:hypothetical protein
MAGNRYVTVSGSQMTSLASADVSAGVADAGKIVGLNSAGKVDITMLPTGIGETTEVKTAGEAIAAGALVQVTATGTVVNADAATHRAAVGFVLSAIANAATGTVYYSGQITGLSGLTPGARYFVGAAGAITTTAPTAAGSIWQPIGRATSATALEFLPQDLVVLA